MNLINNEIGILMVGEDKQIKGGIASVVNAYYISDLIKEHNVIYLPIYIGKNIFIKFYCSVSKDFKIER